MTVMSTTPTLFRRLGGMLSIDAAVDAFYDRVIADPELAPFFERVDLRDQRRHQKAFLAMALGGPLRSGGRSLARMRTQPSRSMITTSTSYSDIWQPCSLPSE